MSSVEVGKIYLGHDSLGHWELKADSLGGIGVQHKFYNASGNEIKYLTFEYVPYNSVGDIVECQIKKESNQLGQITGPIKPYEELTATWDRLWHNPTVKKVEIAAVRIEYADGTKETISGSELIGMSDDNSTYTQREHPKSSEGVVGCDFAEIDASSVTIPNNIKKIAKNAFQGRVCLKKIVFESGSQLESIEEGAFERCGIQSIVIPKSVKTIEKKAFWGCRDLKTITIEEGSQLEHIGIQSFASVGADYCHTQKFVAPKTLKTIGAYAFNESSILMVDLSAATALAKIPLGAFQNCKVLSIFNMPQNAGVTEIESGAFYGCKLLLKFNFKGVTKIGGRAFIGSGIKKATIQTDCACDGAFEKGAQVIKVEPSQMPNGATGTSFIGMIIDAFKNIFKK